MISRIHTCLVDNLGYIWYYFVQLIILCHLSQRSLFLFWSAEGSYGFVPTIKFVTVPERETWYWDWDLLGWILGNIGDLTDEHRERLLGEQKRNNEYHRWVSCFGYSKNLSLKHVISCETLTSQNISSVLPQFWVLISHGFFVLVIAKFISLNMWPAAKHLAEYILVVFFLLSELILSWRCTGY